MKHKAKTAASSSARYVFRIEGLSHEGRGIAHYVDQADHPHEWQGKKVFIRFALPGELVLAEIDQQHKRFDEAHQVDILSAPSPERIAPFCDHFEDCGGCSLQHMHPDQQIATKQQVLASHFTHFAGLAPQQWLSPVRATERAYRHKTRIGVRYLPKSKRLRFGFRQAQSNFLTEIQHCAILDQHLDQALPELKQCLSQLHACGDIGHVELIKGDQQVALLVRHMRRLNASDLKRLRDFAAQRQWQLYLQASAHQLQRADSLLDEHCLSYTLPDFDVRLQFKPTDFIQVNPQVNAKMVKLACDLLDLQAGERVLDLFCGLGNFSLPLARCVGATGQVIAVEASEEMVQRGRHNAQLNGIENVTFYSQDLTKDFSRNPWANQGFDALLIDPPRAGAEQVMHYVSNFGAKRIVYVSCNPATLARDAGILAASGYVLKTAGVIDMFSHTGHVESITLFEKLLDTEVSTF
ncbi:23S rRNA (uracil(1939)-C(5))-methyltransferase RlmD [Acinetobacter larvae]|uniref:23S rRNA (uracil(1939)-C(5))-methyltransferase RlmD n=1 Tax=Acinetobacter larvae TaxID=1789224 RepID=A0A1B2M1V1_9GAMM|nr:23S rRNA (uracil(1939)-C(5))-methyltransferase RlmD [Acinetobacter larvae]AOA59177.1 23S rRNA (uracil(1939)-C(5))-methyltransferase [Acinetobacter larvae]